MNKIILGIAFTVLAFIVFMPKTIKNFGGATTSYPQTTATQTAVLASTTASTALVTANSSRVYALVCNPDTARMFLGLGTSASKNSGAVVYPGTCYEVAGPSTEFVGAINVISASTTSATATVLTLP
jgi:hypothetical protein